MFEKGQYENSLEVLDNTIEIDDKESQSITLNNLLYKCLSLKLLGQPYDDKVLVSLINKKSSKNELWYKDQDPNTNLRLYQLYNDEKYINFAYERLKNLFSYMKSEKVEIASSFPVNKEILEEWEKVN